MNNQFPSWLRSFSFKIEDESDTMLLDETDTNPHNVRFVESPGIRIGEKVLVNNIEYEVVDIQLYSDLDLTEGNLERMDRFYFDLHLIVRKSI